MAAVAFGLEDLEADVKSVGESAADAIQESCPCNSGNVLGRRVSHYCFRKFKKCVWHHRLGDTISGVLVVFATYSVYHMAQIT